MDYYTAKEALVNAEGDIDKALESLATNSSSVGDEIILKVPVNVGIIGGLIGAAAAPWALIAGTIAAFGF